MKPSELAGRLWRALRQPLVATVFGLLVGAAVILACGQNPGAVYLEMFTKSFFSPYYLFSTLTRATPIIICAMATGMAWRAGYINIGVEGQMVAGTFAATVAALYLPGPPPLAALLAWLIGMAAGALYALLPAVLNWKFQVSMVITTLMLNYVANNLASYFVTYPLKDTSGDGLALQTRGETEAEMEEEIVRARELVWQAACAWLELVWCGDGAEELLSQLGCVRVTAQISASGDLDRAGQAAALMRTVSRYREDVSLSLGGDGSGLGGLGALLEDLDAGGYRLSAWRLTA